MVDVIGTASNETLNGFDTDDRIYAKDGDDILYGNLGNDLLDGMAGADQMFGGAGNDRYRVDNIGDVVDEDVDDNGDDGGIELVETRISYVLGDYLENLTLLGSDAIDGAGNDLANKIKGNDAANTLSGGGGADIISGGGGADRLIGGAGADTLTGGAGPDMFVFGPADATSTDRIMDFASDDRIEINAADYGLSEGYGLVNGALDPLYFVTVGSGAQGTAAGHGQFVYNSSERSLMWDADGAGTAFSGIALTTFGSDVSSLLSADDFIVSGSAPPPPPPPPASPVVSVAQGAPDPQTEAAGAKITFVVSLDKASTQDIVVSYSTVDGSATAADDFFGVTNGQLTFLAGETVKTVEIELRDDALVENFETFTLRLNSATNATLGVASASGNIRDADSSGGEDGEFRTLSFDPGAGYTGLVDTFIDQARPTTSFGGSKRLEVDDGSGVTTQALLAFDGIFGSGPGEIPNGATITSATLTFQVTNASSQGGALYRMTTDWSGQSTWASLVDGVGVGTDTASSPDVVTGAVSLGSHSYDVTQSLQAWANGQPNEGWLFDPGGTDGWDITSAEGSIKPTLSVTYWTGSGPPPEPPPVVSVDTGAPNPQTEADGATITFHVSLSKASSEVVTVAYATSDGSASAANDYFAASGTLTFQAGETSKDVTITLKDDTTVERTESFNLTLSEPSNASLGMSTAVGNIRDDEPGGEWQTADPVLVRSTDTRIGFGQNIGAVDPSGIVWIPAQGSQPGRLFISDSEVDESPYNSSTNLFMLNLDGSPQGSSFRFDLRGFTSEPTGLAYNPLNGMLYISDDDDKKIYWVDPANPTQKVGEFDTTHAGALDPEDVAIDPTTGNIFIANGTPSNKITEVTQSGVFVREYTVPSIIKDMEALAYDAQHEVFLVGGGFSSNIWVVDKTGAIVDTIDLSAYRNPVSDTKLHVKDIAFAPTSATDDDPSLMNLYVADYGETHTSDANDGRILEFDLGWNLLA